MHQTRRAGAAPYGLEIELIGAQTKNVLSPYSYEAPRVSAKKSASNDDLTAPVKRKDSQDTGALPGTYS